MAAPGACGALTFSYGQPEPEAPATLIVKLAPDDPASRKRMLEAGFARAEVGFYRDLAARTPLRTPVCHYAEDDAAGAALLLLEDLGDVPATWPPRRIDAEHAAMMLEALAELHARFWNDASLTELPWLHTPAERCAFWQRVLEELAQLLHDAVDGEPPAEVSALLTAWLPRLQAVAAQVGGAPWTLVHGDFTHRNAAVIDGRPVAFDWQLVQRMRGARDVAYLLPFLSLGDDGATDAESLIDDYHAQLVGHGVGDYSRAQLAHDQRVAALEVIQVGLATVWAGLHRAHAAGIQVPVDRLGLSRIAAGVRRLSLVELLEGDFSP